MVCVDESIGCLMVDILPHYTPIECSPFQIKLSMFQDQKNARLSTMKFKSTTVVTEIFPVIFMAGYKNDVYKHCCRNRRRKTQW